jgi:magnesium transporter
MRTLILREAQWGNDWLMTAQTEILAAEHASPTNNGRVWTSAGMTSRAATPAEVGAALKADAHARAWFFLPRQQSEALADAAGHLGIDALAIEDLLGEREPMKLDWIGSSMVAVMRSVTFDAPNAEIDSVPVSVLAGPQAMIVLAGESLRQELCDALDKAEKQILADGIPAAVHAVIDKIVDGYSAALESMEDEVDTLSEVLFDDKPLERRQQLHAFRLRRSLATLRRCTHPMRNIASGLANAAGRAAARHESDDPAPTDPAEKLLGVKSVREFSDVADHADHAAAGADSLREVISSMYETNLALADVHLNTVMKKLTGWAAIIAVPTLITGFMGMNVPYPGFQSRTGFIVAFVIMVAAVSTLFTMLRRRDWI